MARLTFIDLNPIELNYHPFMITLDKCNRSCNVADDISAKISVPSKRKDVNVKLLNMITRINEAKTWVKHIAWDCKCKFDGATFKSNKNGIMINVSDTLRSMCIFENSEYCFD